MSDKVVHEDWPVHAPAVPTCDESLIEDVKTSLVVPPEWKPALQFLSNPQKYPIVPTLPNKLFPRSEIPHRFILTLLASQIIEQIPRPEQSNFGYCFLVEELTKKRYRLVCDTIAVNAAVDTPTPSFTPIAAVRNNIAAHPDKTRFASVYDMKAFFFQFQLHPSVRDNFVFKVGAFYFRFKRLPMGTTFAPTIAQAVLLFLVRSANEEHLLFDAYIDNVLILAPDIASLHRFHTRFMALCEKYGCTVGEISLATRFPSHRGLAFDLENRLFSLTSSFLQKLAAKAHTPRRSHWLTLSADCKQMMGSIIYALTATSQPLADVFPLMRVLARHARHEPVSSIPPTVSALAHSVISNILLNTPRELHVANTSIFTMITDASTSAARGAVILCCPAGNILDLSFRLPSDDINVMEAMAISFGISHFAHRIRQRVVHLVSDNTAVLYALQATQARSWHLNSVIARVLHTIQHLRTSLRLFYVESAANPADGPSRGAGCSRQDLATARDIHLGLQLPQRVVAGVRPIAGLSTRPLLIPATSRKRSSNHVTLHIASDVIDSASDRLLERDHKPCIEPVS